MSRHVNIPIFIPHLGCPNQCIFCNQRKISGVESFDAQSVKPIIDSALETVERDAECEIAFFGGSFTGIDRTLMEELLEIGFSYIKRGRIASIRCSTRPDYISSDIIDTLKGHGVKTVELGIQSSSDKVLSVTKRGHTLEDTLRACKMIVDSGLTLGGQMMIGLPSSTPDDEIATAKLIVASGAKEARIYPTIVFKETELCDLTQNGIYTPLSLEEAVMRSAAVMEIFLKSGVKILRVGLCDSDNLHSESSYFAGPNHAAIGELVENELYYKLISDRLDHFKNYASQILYVDCARGHTSKVIGQNKRNKKRLIDCFSLRDIKVRECDSLDPYELTLKF